MSRATQPAFPAVREMGEFTALAHHGLTIREHFAAMAMQGMLANPLIPDLMKSQKIHPDQVPEWIALGAVEHADALIAELSKEQS